MIIIALQYVYVRSGYSIYTRRSLKMFVFLLVTEVLLRGRFVVVAKLKKIVACPALRKSGI